ncbi:MAG TPA: hypothetical protein PK820_16365 [Candidatus Competibacteraceae bacterium]|nr:hypothetical protein [Candidatus Competibacteraceae bacterium]
MARKPKSLMAQIKTMALRWPNFKPELGRYPQTVVWCGQLAGLERAFTLSIEYGSPLAVSSLLCRKMPVVRVLFPRLVLNFAAEEEAPLPHVYFEDPDYILSPLCLFDPRTGEWNRTMYIADTIVPWAARWLACYELWETTGQWYGGGRHVDLKENADVA